MLFQGLNKLKQKSIMTSIMLMALGVILVIWPAGYTSTLLQIVSAIMVIIAIIMILDYIRSKKSIMDYIKLVGALILGVAGLLFMIFDLDSLQIISWVFGILLIIDGLHSCIHSLIYSRRSRRKGWWVLIPLSVVLIAFGVLIICHPWWNTEAQVLHAIGWMIVGAAVVSAIRLIWVWPLKGE